MPLADYLSNVVAGPSSRKRSYAEISPSESPSSSPNLPAKRRRVSPAASTNSRASISLASPLPLHRTYQPRFQGDGLDFRRPIMPTLAQSEEMPTMIDLTADEEHSSPIPATVIIPRRIPSRVGLSTREEAQMNLFRRAPPFDRARISSTPEVIDLVNDSDGLEPSINTGTRSIRSAATQTESSTRDSPDVMFISSRTLQPPINEADVNRHMRRLPTPPALRTRGTYHLSNLLQRSRELIFGADMGREHHHLANIIPDDLLDRIDGIHPLHRPAGPPNNPPEDDILVLHDNFVEVELDYQAAGFDIGRGLANPAADRNSTPPEILEQEPYKGPAAVTEGFSRNLKGDDVAVCPCCGEELGLGDGDIKQQIWVAKQCGHVYCGDCTKNRAINKSATKRDSRNISKQKVIPLKTCMVDGCKKNLSSKAAMIQIYL